MPVNFDKVREAIKQAAMTAVVRGTESVRDEAVSMVMSGQKTGRIYYRRGVKHQASAPGQAPANDTGTLVNSITTSYNTDKLVGTVNVGAAYGAFLEYGTVKMKPRPFMRPALAAKRADIEADIAASVEKALSG